MSTGKDYKDAFLRLCNLEKAFDLDSGAAGCIERPCYSYWNGIGQKPLLKAVSNDCYATFQNGRSNLDILLMPANDLMQKLENFVVLMSHLDNSYELLIKSILQIIASIEKRGYSEEASQALCFNLGRLKEGIEHANANLYCSSGHKELSYQSCISAVLDTIAALQSPCLSFLNHKITCLQFRCGTTISAYAMNKMNATDRFLSASNEIEAPLRTMLAYVNVIQQTLKNETERLEKILASEPAHHIQDTKQSITEFDNHWKQFIQTITN